MPKRRRKPTLLESAVRGAAAGLLGGAATVLAERFVLPHTSGLKRPRRYRFETQVQQAAAAAGVRLTARQRATASIGLELLIATGLGAVYGVANDHLELGADGKRALYAALGMAMSPVAPQLPTRKKRRGRRTALQRVAASAAEAVTPPTVYNSATAWALGALPR